MAEQNKEKASLSMEAQLEKISATIESLSKEVVCLFVIVLSLFFIFGLKMIVLSLFVLFCLAAKVLSLFFIFGLRVIVLFNDNISHTWSEGDGGG